MLLSCHYHNHIFTPSLIHSSTKINHRQFLNLAVKPYRKSSIRPIAAQSRHVIDEIEPLIDEKPEERFNFDNSFELTEVKRFDSPAVEVQELDELPEQWRRSKLAWLCKELPAHRSSTFVRVLNAQRKWIRQVDCTYIAVHCMRIRENEAAFRVYKWMMQQHWFQFNFALATRLADYMGKERKYLKCREIFDDIVNKGLIPNESTFHILIVAYLSSHGSTCLEEACSIYNRMIHLGRYKPRLSLHNSLFRALVSKTGGSCKHHLKQAEFIFQNLTTCGLKIHSDIYGGLIWLHSYQDVIDKERISSLRAEMKSVGVEENVEVLVSVLRACAKEGDVEEAERTWTKIVSSHNKPPTQAFVHLMEVYSKVEKPMKSLEIFRSMQERDCGSVVAYYKIVEVLCKAREMELAESLMTDFINSGMKPLMESFIDLMEMYANLNMHEKLELTFFRCLEKCNPNRTICGIYLDSLLRTGNLNRAEEIFNQMHENEAVGINSRSCNTILSGYLAYGHHVKAEKIYDLMCQKRYDVESSLTEKLQLVLNSNQEELEKPNLKLSKEQREAVIALLLSGSTVRFDEENKSYAIHFVFRENSKTHSCLKSHIYNQFREWLACDFLVDEDTGDIPNRFSTISHSYFEYYADQFWSQGQPAIPKLINRWLTPRVLAYWYMYGGYRTSSGDILLKLRFGKEDVLRIVRAFKERLLDCRVKTKGAVFWIGLLRSNARNFWELTEPFVLVDLKESLGPEFDSSGGISADSDGDISDYGQQRW